MLISPIKPSLVIHCVVVFPEVLISTGHGHVLQTGAVKFPEAGGVEFPETRGAKFPKERKNGSNRVQFAFWNVNRGSGNETLTSSDDIISNSVALRHITGVEEY